MISPAYQSVRIILNGRAGTVLTMGVENVQEKLTHAFSEAGIRSELVITDGDGLEEAITAAVTCPEEAVVVGGGDGTVRSAARQLSGSGKALGIIPLGTFNLMARDLGMPLDLEEAVTALTRARPRKVDAVELNGDLFLCVSIIGIYPYVAKKREEWRDMPGWRRYPALIRELFRAATVHSSLVLDIKSDAGNRSVRTRFAAVTNNPYKDGFGLIAARESLDAGELAAYVSTHRTRAGLAWSVLRWFGGRWQQDRELKVFHTRELTITSRRRRRIEAVVDGDVEKFLLPLRYKILPGALTVLEPAPPEMKAEEEEKEQPATD